MGSLNGENTKLRRSLTLDSLKLSYYTLGIKLCTLLFFVLVMAAVLMLLVSVMVACITAVLEFVTPVLVGVVKLVSQ